MVAGIDQGIIPVFRQGSHKIVGDRHRKVEVLQHIKVGLDLDEIHDVGMIDSQNRHVGPAPGPALLDGLGGAIKHRHKRERPAGNTLGGVDYVVFGSNPGEGEAGPATALVDQGGLLDRLEDAGHRICDGQDETGRKLTQFAPRIHQGR